MTTPNPGPLAILRDRKKITGDQYAAAQRFGAPEADKAAMLAALDQLPRPSRAVVYWLAVHRRRDWYVDAILHRRKTGNAHLRRTALVRTALQALVGVDRQKSGA